MAHPNELQEEKIVLIQHGDHVHIRQGGPVHPEPAWVLILIIGTIVLLQYLLRIWKKRHYSSFRDVTLFGLCIIPAIVSLASGYTRMLCAWVLFALGTSYVLSLATSKPLKPQTPRLVYTWFYSVYHVCNSLALLGYSAFFAQMVGLGVIFKVNFLSPALLCLFYASYYGVLARDFAELASEKMVSVMGYWSKDGIPSRHLLGTTCAICDTMLDLPAPKIEDRGKSLLYTVGGAKAFKLNCGHFYHEFCLRGWTIIGKKDTCAYCMEKVDLKEYFTNPWEAQTLLWGTFLDAIRYLVVWNPVILLLCGTILRYLGHNHTSHETPQGS